MSGWLKLHRETLDWEWYGDHNTCRLFFHLLLRANYKPSRYMGYEIPAGSIAAGIDKLAEQTGLSVQQVRTALTKLKSTNEITIKTTNKFSIITMIKWETYQEDNEQNNNQVTNDQQTDNKRITPSKEGKKEEGKKDIKPAGVSDETWGDFLKLRAKKEAPVTQTAINGICKEAERAGWTVEDALRECCLRGWQSFKAEWVTKESKNGKSRIANELQEILGQSGDR